MSLINSEHTIICYRATDRDSYDVAIQYMNFYNMSLEQVIPIPCSDNEILEDYGAFYNEVELPVASAITALDRDIYVIILGYNIPGGFYDGVDIISSTSRVARLDYDFEKFQRSFLFDRQQYSDYDEIDRDHSYIVARIDGPTKEDAIEIITNSERASAQANPVGRFYLDMGYNITDDIYKDDLLMFSDRIPKLTGLEVFRTLSVQEYEPDDIFPFAEDDAIFWGFFDYPIDASFFHDNVLPRYFFYNSENSSALGIRNIDTNNWLSLAIHSGYPSGAGLLSPMRYTGPDPASSGMLKPAPFFDALLRGKTMGESYILGLEFYDSPMTFIGDPLLKIPFSGSVDNISIENINDNNTEWVELINEISETMADYIRFNNTSQEAVETVAASDDIEFKLDNLSQSYNLSLSMDDITGLFRSTVDHTLQIIRSEDILDISGNKFNDIDSLLSTYNLYINQLVNTQNYTTINPASIYIIPQESWSYNFLLYDNLISSSNHSSHSVIQLANYSQFHFKLIIANNESFTDIEFETDSSESQEGWQYETRWKTFDNLQSWGLSSAYIGSIVRFYIDGIHNLERGKLYYTRLQQWDILTQSTPVNHDYFMVVST